MKCKICGSKSNMLFEGTVLKKYKIKYFKCEKCGFIQTESPFWLEESYQSDFDFLDVGMISRNIESSKMIKDLLLKIFLGEGKYLDFGGGSGILVRIMRDLGFDFYLSDKYNENVYAKYFDVDSLPKNLLFNAVTSLEVFEHFVEPMDEINKLFDMSDTVIFSTCLVPDYPLRNTSDWWYFVPQTGQHVSLFSKTSLEFIAEEKNAQLYTNGTNYHILTKKKIKNPFTKSLNEKIVTRIKSMLEPKSYSNSLLDKDFQFYKDIIDDKIPSISTQSIGQ